MFLITNDFGATFKYSFENYDIPSFPSMEMGFLLQEHGK
jgi:hypothetical protein